MNEIDAPARLAATAWLAALAPRIEGIVLAKNGFASVRGTEGAYQDVHVGTAGNIPHREIMMELHYLAQVTPSSTFEPNLQYIVNPDQSSEPYRKTNIPNAFVMGLQFTVDLARLAGFAAPE